MRPRRGLESRWRAQSLRRYTLRSSFNSRQLSPPVATSSSPSLSSQSATPSDVTDLLLPSSLGPSSLRPLLSLPPLQSRLRLSRQRRLSPTSTGLAPSAATTASLPEPGMPAHHTTLYSTVFLPSPSHQLEVFASFRDSHPPPKRPISSRRTRLSLRSPSLVLGHSLAPIVYECNGVDRDVTSFKCVCGAPKSQDDDVEI